MTNPRTTEGNGGAERERHPYIVELSNAIPNMGMRWGEDGHAWRCKKVADLLDAVDRRLYSDADLSRRCEALERDAARYRGLRDFAELAVRTEQKTGWLIVASGADLDKQIDAALAERSEKAGG